ncbi:MAG: SpoIIE family protein phosphatase, partial [Rhodospirillales bacterium]|nr:SpoIIE family protein phosphatase [Rhodospirillales bacterium]
GINAAMLMAKTASLYRCLGKTETRPGKLLARLNEEISETATRGMFVTIVGGIYNPENMTVRVANAGHEPPLLRKSDGRYERFEAEAPPVGISADAVGENGYPEFEISLAGGALYLFTDGVTEGKRGDGSMLGADGVEAILEDTAALDLRSRLERIVDVFDTKDLHDDITIVGIDSSAPDQITAASPDEGAATVPLLEYNFPARAGRLRDARHAMRRFLEDAGYDGTLVPDVVLAVDEACQNIIRHAYGGDSDLEIQLAVSLEPRRLIIELTDSADPVNTEEVRPRQLDNVRPGGLGVHFMHEIMDEVAYVSVPGNSGNVLRMVKNSAEDVEAVEAKEDMKE